MACEVLWGLGGTVWAAVGGLGFSTNTAGVVRGACDVPCVAGDAVFDGAGLVGTLGGACDGWRC